MTLMNHIIDRCFTLLNKEIKEMDERFEELKRELFDWGSDYNVLNVDMSSQKKIMTVMIKNIKVKF